MNNSVTKLRAPHRGDTQLIREGGSARWQARDGMVIQVAAAEPGREGRPAPVARRAPALQLLLNNCARLVRATKTGVRYARRMVAGYAATPASRTRTASGRGMGATAP